MRVKDNKKIKRVGGRDTFSITCVWVPSDIKKALQRHLRELIMFNFSNRFYENELVELLMQKVFSIYPDKHAKELAEWGFKVALRKEYVTTNSWDKNSPTIYFINPQILENVPGPKGPRTERGYKELERKLRKQREKEENE